VCKDHAPLPLWETIVLDYQMAADFDPVPDFEPVQRRYWAWRRT
jgi:hypothetical protein